MDTLMGGLNVRTKKLLLTIIASRLQICNMQHILSFGKVLRAYYTKFASQLMQMAKNKNLGMVKVNRIRQPACLRASETERMWVRVKHSCLRYSPFSLGNLRVEKCLLQLECLLCWLLQDYYLYHFLIFHRNNELLDL
jgi:hypothetical protein